MNNELQAIDRYNHMRDTIRMQLLMGWQVSLYKPLNNITGFPNVSSHDFDLLKDELEDYVKIPHSPVYKTGVEGKTITYQTR